MKKLFLFSFVLSTLLSCNEAPKNPPVTTTVISDAKASADTNLVNQLAAFYTGTVPCADCAGIASMLTLNADEKRTFTLEETYKGEKEKTIESKGTWTVSEGIVTLNGDAGSSKYQITDEGLVSLNTDGSKREAKSAEKYLLKKVMGE